MISDELDKTIISVSQCQSKLEDDNITKSKVDLFESKIDIELNLVKEEKPESNGLKNFIENKLNVKIESSVENVKIVDSKSEQEPTVFDKFFKSFNGPEESKIKKNQNEQDLNRIFELLNKTNEQVPTVQSLKTEDNSSSLESSNLIKFLLKIDKKDENLQKNSNEVDLVQLDSASSIYKNCPTTLNKILSNTKNPIIVDTSHQPGNLFTDLSFFLRILVKP